jgi:hypothetical protein
MEGVVIAVKFIIHAVQQRHSFHIRTRKTFQVSEYVFLEKHSKTEESISVIV